MYKKPNDYILYSKLEGSLRFDEITALLDLDDDYYVFIIINTGITNVDYFGLLENSRNYYMLYSESKSSKNISNIIHVVIQRMVDINDNDIKLFLQLIGDLSNRINDKKKIYILLADNGSNPAVFSSIIELSSISVDKVCFCNIVSNPKNKSETNNMNMILEKYQKNDPQATIFDIISKLLSSEIIQLDLWNVYLKTLDGQIVNISNNSSDLMKKNIKSKCLGSETHLPMIDCLTLGLNSKFHDILSQNDKKFTLINNSIHIEDVSKYAWIETDSKINFELLDTVKNQINISLNNEFFDVNSLIKQNYGTKKKSNSWIDEVDIAYINPNFFFWDSITKFFENLINQKKNTYFDFLILMNLPIIKHEVYLWDFSKQESPFFNNLTPSICDQKLEGVIFKKRIDSEQKKFKNFIDSYKLLQTNNQFSLNFKVQNQKPYYLTIDNDCFELSDLHLIKVTHKYRLNIIR